MCQVKKATKSDKQSIKTILVDLGVQHQGATKPGVVSYTIKQNNTILGFYSIDWMIGYPLQLRLLHFYVKPTTYRIRNLQALIRSFKQKLKELDQHTFIIQLDKKKQRLIKLVTTYFNVERYFFNDEEYFYVAMIKG